LISMKKNTGKKVLGKTAPKGGAKGAPNKATE
jgi:hypothetical protein